MMLGFARSRHANPARYRPQELMEESSILVIDIICTKKFPAETKS